MQNENQPLAEVFGHLPTDFRSRAIRHRENKLCPFNNKVEEVAPSEAEVAWLVYDLVLDAAVPGYKLTKTQVVYTKFLEALNTIARPEVGRMENFVKLLQARVDEKQPSTPTNQGSPGA